VEEDIASIGSMVGCCAELLVLSGVIDGSPNVGEVDAIEGADVSDMVIVLRVLQLDLVLLCFFLVLNESRLLPLPLPLFFFFFQSFLSFELFPFVDEVIVGGTNSDAK
jgi:hypothetical protein